MPLGDDKVDLYSYSVSLERKLFLKIEQCGFSRSHLPVAELMLVSRLEGCLDWFRFRFQEFFYH